MDTCNTWTSEGLSSEVFSLQKLILQPVDEGSAPGFYGETDSDGLSSCLADDAFSHVQSISASSSVSPVMSAFPASCNAPPIVDSSKPVRVEEETLSLTAFHEGGDSCTVVGAKRVKLDQNGAPLKALSSQSQVPKIAEKITALQQLVSPFGKTDTASVLLEAIGYIKFLQDQVHVLSSPYMKANLSSKEGSVVGMDLRSRGLCLVPISCTKNVANSNGADYWISGISGCSR